jgi:hypothetical protein
LPERAGSRPSRPSPSWPSTCAARRPAIPGARPSPAGNASATVTAPSKGADILTDQLSGHFYRTATPRHGQAPGHPSPPRHRLCYTNRRLRGRDHHHAKGVPPVESEPLTARIRDRVAAGLLPRSDCTTTWFGYGNGRLCPGCDQPIRPTDIEVECDLPNGTTLHFHRHCFDVWTRTRRDGQLCDPTT